ncbi:probable 28S ribosomal protein S26, mitochondrial [Episyrphus balteatus]|uniref:probable 28S ribosomal protein S26, mitochondrial n=1 Tax=Episyrphus balteatus TaxID=286459 RepID=UPI002485D9EB|nr:probable 28S ribosomal protein S26, mitochondrial [Episyrphus balteatus]
MFRSALTVLSQTSETKITNCSIGLEFVRWRRKPRWLPVAKSKVFRIPEKKPQTEDEKLELLRLHNHYKTQMRSMRMYLREESQRIRETSTADHLVETPEQEEQEFQRCVDLNKEWNAKIAGERNARLAKEYAERREFIKERLELAKEREEDRLQRIEEIVRKEKEAAKNFITRENIDAAIETALANPLDYNFSIDLRGNLYHGRTTVPGGSPDQKQPEPELLAAAN